MDKERVYPYPPCDLVIQAFISPAHLMEPNNRQKCYTETERNCCILPPRETATNSDPETAPRLLWALTWQTDGPRPRLSHLPAIKAPDGSERLKPAQGRAAGKQSHGDGLSSSLTGGFCGKAAWIPLSGSSSLSECRRQNFKDNRTQISLLLPFALCPLEALLSSELLFYYFFHFISSLKNSYYVN